MAQLEIRDKLILELQGAQDRPEDELNKVIEVLCILKVSKYLSKDSSGLSDPICATFRNM